MSTNIVDCVLSPLLSFGEEVIPYENREYEEMFNLYVLHRDFYEEVLVQDKHWCLDRMEVFSQDDDYEYLQLCKNIINFFHIML